MSEQKDKRDRIIEDQKIEIMILTAKVQALALENVRLLENQKRKNKNPLRNYPEDLCEIEKATF